MRGGGGGGTIRCRSNKSNKESHSWENYGLSAGQERLHFSGNSNLTQPDISASNIRYSSLQCWSATLPSLQQLWKWINWRTFGDTNLTVVEAFVFMVKTRHGTVSKLIAVFYCSHSIPADNLMFTDTQFNVSTPLTVKWRNKLIRIPCILLKGMPARALCFACFRICTISFK